MKKLLVALMVVAFPACSFGGTGAVAPQSTAKAKAAVQSVMKASKDGFMAMRAVHAARIAIFDGQPKLAMELMNKAKNSLDVASKDESLFVKDFKAAVGNKAASNVTAADWIPIDGQITLADTFVASPEKNAHVEKANEHFKQGRAKEAIEELRLGAIDVNYTRVMMSLSATKACVTSAMKLAEEHKYYEANLALKAADDAIIVDSLNLAGVAQPENQQKTQPNNGASNYTTETTTK